MQDWHNWMDGFDAAVTVVDKDLNILYMNDKAMSAFEKYGGKGLIGKNLAGCHTGRSMEIMKGILETGRANVYTIDKGGIKALVYQSTWSVNGSIAGLVEIAFKIPSELPHHVRDV